MSYLVDALKKAERERYSRQARDTNALSVEAGPGTIAPRASAPLIWLVAILVASNVALAIYVWRPRPAHSAPAVPMAAARSLARVGQPAGAMSQVTAPGSNGGGAIEQNGARPEAATGMAANRPRRDNQAPRMAASSPATSAPANTAATQAGTAVGSQQSGHVTYSKAPLTAGSAGDASAGQAADGGASGPVNADMPDQSSVGDVPSVEINGQLYSTVPGRSFILVNGRRYHEGERLAAGPAVESIGPNGATLRYHGQRYHVAGPG